MDPSDVEVLGARHRLLIWDLHHFGCRVFGSTSLSLPVGPGVAGGRNIRMAGVTPMPREAWSRRTGTLAHLPFDNDEGEDGDGDGKEKERPLGMFGPDEFSQPQNPTACTDDRSGDCGHPLGSGAHDVALPVSGTGSIEASFTRPITWKHFRSARGWFDVMRITQHA